MTRYSSVTSEAVMMGEQMWPSPPAPWMKTTVFVEVVVEGGVVTFMWRSPEGRETRFGSGPRLGRCQ